MDKDSVKEKIESSEVSGDTDPFTRLMFGRPRGLDKKKENSSPAADDVNFSTIIQQFDDIMGSINKIKPALKDLSPLLDFFKQKK